MSNATHIKVVRGGPEAIGAWRDRNPHERMDLSQAIIDGAGLEGADLRATNLVATHFTAVSFSGDHLKKPDVGGVRLNYADLRGANLHLAVFRGVNLRGADFSQSTCGWTVFGDVNLAGAKGLETITHKGPSLLGSKTLALSKGRLPAEFLRGCGLSDWEIEGARLYDPELSHNKILDIQQLIYDIRAGSPLQIGALFISYTHADSAFVDVLEEKLKDKGIRFWRDIHDAPAGPLDKIVDRAMRLNPTVLLVLSKNSIESDWVEDEASRARALEKELGRHVLCPVALDRAWESCGWSQTLRTQIKKYNILPFAGWEDPRAFDKMFNRLVQGLSIFYPRMPTLIGDLR